VIGTFLFGLISYLTNNQRLSILSVGAFFIIGLALLQRVDDTRAAQTV
jgi:MFS-type transporter involved in bile tolerance (Atg22 family)